MILKKFLKSKIMSKIDTFLKQINDGYDCKGDYIALGSAMLDGETVA